MINLRKNGAAQFSAALCEDIKCEYISLSDACFLAPLNKSIRVWVDFEDRELYEGDALLIPPKSLFAFEVRDEAKCVFMRFREGLYLSPDFDSFSEYSVPTLYIFDMLDELKNIDFNTVNSYTLSSFASKISGLYDESEKEIKKKLSAKEIKKKRIYDYIADHYKEAITNESIANEMGCSLQYASHILHMALGENVRECVNRYRTLEARRLLSSTDYDIAKVAKLCGFSSIRSFDMVFLKNSGITPREFKSKYGL